MTRDVCYSTQNRGFAIKLHKGNRCRGDMLLYHVRELCNGTLLLMLLVMTCAGYSYYVNSKRPDHDPKKRNFHPIAIILAPVTFPLFIIFSLSIFLIRVLIYGAFMILLTFALLVIRKPFLVIWLRKTAVTCGNVLLETNTLLIKLFLRPWANEPGM